LQWLKDAALIHFCYAVEKVEIPLKGFTVPGVFKVYALDVGLLAAMAGIDTKTLIKGDELFSTYHGAFVENYVAQELAARSEQSLYYWKSEGKKAEVDFLFQKRNTVFPLEVKAGINPKSKSLHSYDTYFQPQKLLRSTLLNLKWNGKIINIPLYALGAVKRFC